jgi:hypothetical protein
MVLVVESSLENLTIENEYGSIAWFSEVACRGHQWNILLSAPEGLAVLWQASAWLETTIISSEVEPAKMKELQV